MKLKNKKNGGIIEIIVDNGVLRFKRLDDKTKEMSFNSLAELNAEWEDCEEPKEYYWYIDDLGIVSIDRIINSSIAMRKNFGNYFDTREEAEKAVEKLKAWKLLKDECNIKFNGLIRNDRGMLKGVKLVYDRHEVTLERMRECVDALHLIFGGEE